MNCVEPSIPAFGLALVLGMLRAMMMDSDMRLAWSSLSFRASFSRGGTDPSHGGIESAGPPWALLPGLGESREGRLAWRLGRLRVGWPGDSAVSESAGRATRPSPSRQVVAWAVPRPTGWANDNRLAGPEPRKTFLSTARCPLVARTRFCMEGLVAWVAHSAGLPAHRDGTAAGLAATRTLTGLGRRPHGGWAGGHTHGGWAGLAAAP